MHVIEKLLQDTKQATQWMQRIIFQQRTFHFSTFNLLSTLREMGRRTRSTKTEIASEVIPETKASVASPVAPRGPAFDKESAHRYLIVDEFDLDAVLEKGLLEYTGVRNREARNNLKRMKSGQDIFLYRAHHKEKGIVAIGHIQREAYPDPTQFDPQSKYYDSQSAQDDPTWVSIDVRIVRKMSPILLLQQLKSIAQTDDVIKGMQLLTRPRLSVQLVSDEQWDRLLLLEKELGMQVPAASS
jgi:predicted RNA-binding protein with PUA-like domain